MLFNFIFFIYNYFASISEFLGKLFGTFETYIFHIYLLYDILISSKLSRMIWVHSGYYGFFENIKTLHIFLFSSIFIFYSNFIVILHLSEWCNIFNLYLIIIMIILKFVFQNIILKSKWQSNETSKCFIIFSFI